MQPYTDNNVVVSDIQLHDAVYWQFVSPLLICCVNMSQQSVCTDTSHSANTYLHLVKSIE